MGYRTERCGGHLRKPMKIQRTIALGQLNDRQASGEDKSNLSQRKKEKTKKSLGHT